MEDEDGKHAWDGASVSTGRIRCTINSRRGQVSLPAYTHCYDISACGFEPDTAETALQSGAADTIVVGCHPVSNPDLPRCIERRTCACNVPQAYRFDTHGYNDYPPEQGRYPRGVQRAV